MRQNVSESAYREQRLRHFHQLDREQQCQAIQRLAASGHGDATIAQATALSVEQIRRILAEAAA
jgi:hypothetical protein